MRSRVVKAVDMKPSKTKQYQDRRLANLGARP